MNEKTVYKDKNSQLNIPYNDLGVKLSDIPLNEYSGIGKARNITEFGNGYFQNYNLNITNNDNASIIVPNDWKANEITCNILNIYDYDNYWVNNTFDSGFDSDFWKSYTGRPQNVSFGWYDAPTGTNDSIYMRFEEANVTGTPWNNVNSYWNHTLLVPREHIPFEIWEITFKYRILYSNKTWLPGTGGAHHSLFVDVIGTSREFYQIKLNNLVNNTWYNGNVPLFQPEEYGWQLPGTISLLFEIGFGNSGINPTGYLEVYYDNITLKLSTIPKPSQINLTINDDTNNFSTEINDLVEYGEGTVNLENTWNGDEGGKSHYFLFSHNSSGNIIISSDFFTNATSSRKTATQLGLEGTEFMVENNSKTQWTIYFIVSQPGSYSDNYYVNISKPLNWAVTEAIDPYSNNKINDVIGSGYGNTTFTVPNHIISNGLWKFVAEAPNYVEETNIFRKSTSTWKQNNTFYSSDKLKINGTIRTSLIPDIDNTNTSLKIYYSNGTIWYQEEKISVDASGTFEFSEITLGSKNITSGKYSAQIIWNDHDLNMSQVGIKLLEFKVIHKTNLTAIDSYFEILAGDPLLLKVKYIDSDLNISIPYATITYNSTFGSSGNLVYLGSGIYFSEIDTNSLDLGDYYFSFNAKKSFYENKTFNNLIHLKIIPEPLALELSDSILETNANSIVSCQVNVVGAITKTLIWPANVSTDWFNPYNITDYGNGTYILDFSTEDIPESGYLESYTIKILANKTGYGNTNIFLTLLVHPIPTFANVNTSLISVYQDDIIKVRANYTDENLGELITEANCSVTWQGSYLITPISNEFEITLNTTGLNVDYYTVLITFKRAGYETAFTSITIIINEKEVNMVVTINEIEINENSLVEAYFQQQINISVRVSTVIEPEYLSGGIITFISDYYQENLTESPSTYFNISIILDGAYFDSGISTIFLRFQQTNYSTKIFAFQLYIRAQPIDLTVEIDYQGVPENYLFEISYNQIFHLSCRAFAEIEAKFLSGGNITFVNGEYEINFIEYEQNWFNLSILVSASTFSLGPNYAYIRFQQNNYTTTTFSIQIFVNQIEIKVEPLNFQELVEGIEGNDITIRLRLMEDLSSEIIANATIFYVWNFGNGYFEYISNGTYESKLSLPIGHSGNYPCRLVISMESAIYKSFEYSIIINIIQRETPNYFMWIIIIPLIVIISFLGILSLRSYVFLPRKRRKKSELLAKTQRYKDIMNIEAVFISQKQSGLYIYSKDYYYITEEDQSELLTGFIHAITLLSTRVAGREELKEMAIISKDVKNVEKIIELDFKHFNFFICDYKDLRITFILKEKASERFKNQTAQLLSEIDSLFSEKLEKWDGNLAEFSKILPSLFDQYLHLYYREQFKLNKIKYINRIKEEESLSKMELRLINVIISMTKEKIEFYLEDAIKSIHEKNTDKVIEALESLIERKIVIPS